MQALRQLGRRGPAAGAGGGSAADIAEYIEDMAQALAVLAAERRLERLCDLLRLARDEAHRQARAD